MRLILNKMIMKNIIYVLFVGCLLLSSCGNGTSSKNNDSSNDDAILTEMLEVHEQRQALMSRINSTYTRYRQQLSSGSAAAYGSEAGMWQLREDMEKLCDKYIQLAKRLSDNQEVVEEAERQKRNIMNAFDDMGFRGR